MYGKEKATYILCEIHEEVCDNHAGGLVLERKHYERGIIGLLC